MSGKSLKVLQVTPCIYPATRWGGPAYSVYALCNGLAKREDIVLTVLANDAAGPARDDRLTIDSRLMSHYRGYVVRFYHRMLGHAIAPGLFAQLWREVGAADVVHVTGTYNFPTPVTFLVARLRGKPLMWSPRGALQASAEWTETSQPVAKRIWEAMLRVLAPPRTFMHVTAESEQLPSQARMPGMDAILIPNGVDLPADWTPVPPVAGRPVRLMFLSRVHPKKGIDLLLEALAMLGEGFELDVYGSGDANYLAQLAVMARKLGVAPRVRFHGHVDGEAKAAAYAAADMLVLPTHSENFGLVIAEALAAARPVVTTKNAPWRGLEAHDCGRWIDNEVDAIVAAVRDVAASDMGAMGARGRSWMEVEFGWEGIAARMAVAYGRMVSTA